MDAKRPCRNPERGTHSQLDQEHLTDDDADYRLQGNPLD